MQSSASSEVMGKEAELQVRLANGRIKCTACASLALNGTSYSAACSLWFAETSAKGSDSAL
jgi:hypothetical protein